MVLDEAQVPSLSFSLRLSFSLSPSSLSVSLSLSLSLSLYGVYMVLDKAQVTTFLKRTSGCVESLLQDLCGNWSRFRDLRLET